MLFVLLFESKIKKFSMSLLTLQLQGEDFLRGNRASELLPSKGEGSMSSVHC